MPLEERQAKPLLAWPDALTVARLPLAVVFFVMDDPVVRAAALATASETPKMAFAPSLPLFRVPSSSMRVLSMRR